jgi:hypothetical protein
LINYCDGNAELSDEEYENELVLLKNVIDKVQQIDVLEALKESLIDDAPDSVVNNLIEEKFITISSDRDSQPDCSGSRADFFYKIIIHLIEKIKIKEEERAAEAKRKKEEERAAEAKRKKDASSNWINPWKWSRTQ